MPRVKIDYIVSFSSEDKDNPANNLLLELGKQKWLCEKGEPSCSVVLQLPRAVKIHTVNVGAYHAALVEVLVGLSEKPNDQYQVLVPSSVFLSPMDSRRGEGIERVRSFSYDQLSADSRDKKWDRVRVVCSQPYNKHCKYGLSFIQLTEPEAKGASADVPTSTTTGTTVPTAGTTGLAVPPRLFAADATSSDEDDFKPGELFARHQKGEISTDAQIRQATSQALKNIATTKLTKTPITKATTKRYSEQAETQDDRQANRKRTSLMYDDDDEQPHAKIDKVVNRHKDEKAKRDDEARKKIDEKKNTKEHKNDKPKDDANRNKDSAKDAGKRDENRTPQTKKRDRNSPTPGQSKDKRDGRKGKTDDKAKTKKTGPRPGPVSSSPHTLLSGVIFVMSGYENPRRAKVRDAALAMGASFRRDWTGECTHLICAFPNTPKLKAVRASHPDAIAVTADWIDGCCRRRRRLPWQWYATEPAKRIPEPDDGDDDDEEVNDDGQGSDTDIEADREPLQPKRRRLSTPSPPPRPIKDEPKITRERSMSPDTANSSVGSDVTFVKDERIKGNVTIEDSDTDIDADNDVDTDADTTIEYQSGQQEEIDPSRALPDFFSEYTFAIEAAGGEADESLLRRYVRAYGGRIVEASDTAKNPVDYWVCSGSPSKAPSTGQRVTADWLWKCHEAKQLVPVGSYIV